MEPLEILSYIGIGLGLFFSGMSIGAIIEYRRLNFLMKIKMNTIVETHEILRPFITNAISTKNSTWVELEPMVDPDITQDIPKVE